MPDILLSIIVPIYKVEKYVAECLDSIKNNSNSRYEVILVNDGSPDNSGNIAKQYTINDDRFKYLEKSNGGLSSARNFGIEHAAGRYLWFVDSDDYIKKNAIDKIIEKLECHPGIDVLVINLMEFYGDTVLNPSLTSKHSEMFFGRNEYLKGRYLYDSPCAPKYIVNKEIIERKRIRFIENRLHEDIAWSFMIAVNLESILVIDEVMYFHRKNRPGSITYEANDRRAIDIVMLLQEMTSLAEHESDRGIQEVLMRKIGSYLYNSFNYISLTSNLLNEYLLQTVKLENYFNYPLSDGQKIAKCIYTMFGENTLMLFYSIKKRIRIKRTANIK